MSDLNLDELIPESKTITFSGKSYICHPPTVEQMLRVAELETKLEFVKTYHEAIDLINDTLKPIVPDIKASELKKDQLTGLISFIITGAVPERLTKKMGKKKQESPKQ